MDYPRPANLLHPLSLNDGTSVEVQVTPIGQRHFRLTPWPFAEEQLTFSFPARHVEGKTFDASKDLEKALSLAGDPRQRAEIALELAGAYAALYRLPEGVEVLERALAELGEADAALAARLESELALSAIVYPRSV